MAIDMLEKLKEYQTVSIIGMDKNVGKTTVLNYILKEARGKLTLGLTSIGRDGEDKDIATETEKPRIYIEKGTFIATAKQCLFKGDITKEIIESTAITTSMGEVVIAKALSDGYVELGGASINTYSKDICSRLLSLGSKMVIVDGALNRKTMASPAFTEAAILSTGASMARQMDSVVEMTSHTVRLLSLDKETDKSILDIVNNQLSSVRIAMIYKDKTFKKLRAKTSFEASEEIVENLNDRALYLLIRGVVTNGFLESIIKVTDKYKGVTFLVEDGTKLFIGKNTFLKFEKMGGKLKVVKAINLICITCNPKSPYGYEFDKHLFLERLRENISLPVFDVVGGG